jgi:hypothetical protein
MASLESDGLFPLMASFQKADKDRLYAHQRYAVRHLIEHPGKSALICYSMGTGKTVIVANYCVHHFEGKVVYMGPKSLHPVFFHHVSAAGGDVREVMPGTKTRVLRYSTVTSEAANVYTQVAKEVEPILGPISIIDRRSATQDERGEPTTHNPLILIIMDECHLFSTRVAKILSSIHYSRDDSDKLEAQEKEAYKLYRFLCRDPRVRIVAITGTPVKTHPFNLVPILNIVRREITSMDGKRSLAFPEVFGRFYESFVRGLLASRPSLASYSTTQEKLAREKERIPLSVQRTIELKKFETFVTRLRNLILWYEAPKGLPSVPFPTIESEEVISIPMKQHQWKIYRKMEEEERRIEESFRRDRPDRAEGMPLLDDLSVYRSLTRQSSNFAFPEDLYIGKHRSAQEMLVMTPSEVFNLDNIGNYACKIEAILRRLLKMDDRIHGIFSSFVKGAGIAAIEKCLDALGWKSLNEILRKGPLKYSYVAELVKKDTTLYMTLTGDTSPEMKSRLIEVFNQPENARDNLIRAVLYSGASAHGLTFKSGRVIHFLEPQWDDVEEAQARDRFIRINSAAFLPFERRKVQVFYYLAVHPDPTAKDETTDQHLQLVSNRKAELNGIFIEWLRCAAVNCTGMFLAESNLHSEMIANREVPPNRIFFRCVTCAARYNQSYFLQELTDCQCVHVPPDPPTEKSPHAIVLMHDEKTYLLDRRSGTGWIMNRDPVSQRIIPTVITDAILLRQLWRQALESSRK